MQAVQCLECCTSSLRQPPLAEPLAHGPGRELGTVVGADVIGRLMLNEGIGEQIQDIVRSDPPTNKDGQALPAVLVDHRQHPEDFAVVRQIAVPLLQIPVIRVYSKVDTIEQYGLIVARCFVPYQVLLDTGVITGIWGDLLEQFENG